MPCCKLHDDLGKKQISVEYTNGSCGSIRLELVHVPMAGVSLQAPYRIMQADQASPDAVPYLDPGDPHHTLLGYGKPDYCCFQCPTLLATLGVPTP